MPELKDLKKEADDLGVSYPSNITATKLSEKIEAFYEAQETSQVDIPEDQKDVDVNPSPSQPKHKLRELAARKTHVVTIVDNDQRVNNHTTTCTVNCSNEFFDLGTMVLPLNEKIEVATGHIKTLEQVRIPMHVVDTRTGMATVRMRPRYTISYENIDPK